MHIFPKNKLYQAIFILILSVAGMLLPAADDYREQTSKRAEMKSSRALVAGVVSLGVPAYALADYYGKLPAWMPSLRSRLTELPDRSRFCLGGATVSLIGLTATAALCWGLDTTLQKELAELDARSQLLQMLKRQAALEGNQNFDTKLLEEFSDEERPEAKAFLKAYSFSDQEQLFSSLSLPPECIRTRCRNYAGAFPPRLSLTAKQAARDVGISEPVFFYLTEGECQAADEPFNRIGFNLKTIAVFDPKYQSSFALLGREELYKTDFYRALYHELCHIKGKHLKKDFWSARMARSSAFEGHLQRLVIPTNEFGGTVEWRCPESKPEECTPCKKLALLKSHPKEASSLYRRYKEMEAELGAVYYLRRLRGISIESFGGRYPEDDLIHATGEDQSRYNGILSAQMEADPGLEYSAVQNLAKQYLVEKNPYFAILFEDEPVSSFGAASSYPSSSSSS